MPKEKNHKIIIMKVIGIICSARQHGNTDFLIQKSMDAAIEGGAEETEIIFLGDKSILPCTGCETCLETGNCKIEDDMQEIYPKLLAADGIIIGAPVYFWGISGLAKIFMDRTFCLAISHLAIIPEIKAKMKGGKIDLRNKVGGIVIATSRVGGATALRQVNDFFRIHRMIEAGSAVAFGFKKGEVEKDKQGINEAYWTGKSVVRAIKQQMQYNSTLNHL